jgi:hypothetical protein
VLFWQLSNYFHLGIDICFVRFYIKYISKREDKSMTTSNTTAQIATFLNVSPNQIKSVTEMAWVFCVVVKGCRARFVSKKAVKEKEKEKGMEMTRSQLANKISSDLDCTSKVWEKGDKVRVYLSHRGKDYGFVEIATKGVEFNLSGYANNVYGRVIRESIEGIKIKPESFRGQMLRTAAQPDSIQDSWDAYHKAAPDREYFFGAADEESY